MDHMFLMYPSGPGVFFGHESRGRLAEGVPRSEMEQQPKPGIEVIKDTQQQMHHQQHHDTHDTCSCGSEDQQHKKNASSHADGGSASLQLSPSNGSSSAVIPPFAPIVKPAYVNMDEELAKELVAKTQARVEHTLHKSSMLLQPEMSVDTVPRFTMDEDITRGELLGSGGFANVYAIELKGPQRINDDTTQRQYVVKHMSPKLVTSGGINKNHTPNRKLQLGAKDLVLESHLLSALNHDNILKCHGVSRCGIQGWSDTLRTDAYFMILPRLSCTLADKLSHWKRQRLLKMQAPPQQTPPEKKTPWWKRHNIKRNSFSSAYKQSPEELAFLCERLQILVNLCHALEYLHDNRIMHRDIKPPNVGFDHEGTLKLFDFGLAKELPQDSLSYTSESRSGNHHHIMTTTFANMGNTGTTRYMAPEIIRREPYNCKVDVFATSICIWECMTLKKPYGTDVSGQFVKECVAIYDDRPTIPTTTAYSRRHYQTAWPKALKKVVQQGWTRDISMRLSATQMKEGLQSVLDKKQQQLDELLLEQQQSTTMEQPSSSSLNHDDNDEAQC